MYLSVYQSFHQCASIYACLLNYLPVFLICFFFFFAPQPCEEVQKAIQGESKQGNTFQRNKMLVPLKHHIKQCPLDQQSVGLNNRLVCNYLVPLALLLSLTSNQ